MVTSKGSFVRWRIAVYWLSVVFVHYVCMLHISLFQKNTHTTATTTTCHCNNHKMLWSREIFKRFRKNCHRTSISFMPFILRVCWWYNKIKTFFTAVIRYEFPVSSSQEGWASVWWLPWSQGITLYVQYLQFDERFDNINSSPEFSFKL